MKKALILIFLTITAVFGLASNALAADTVQLKIPANVKGGGTITIISQTNSPMPKNPELQLEDGQQGSIIIDFSEAGDYFYTIAVKPDDRNIYFDSASYNLKVTVVYEGGALKAYPVMYKSGNEDEKSEKVHFENGVKPEKENPKPTSPQTKAVKKPYTGDDSLLETYLLIAFLASLGLFALSVVYYRSAGQKEQKSE